LVDSFNPVSIVELKWMPGPGLDVENNPLVVFPAREMLDEVAFVNVNLVAGRLPAYLLASRARTDGVTKFVPAT